MKAGRSRTDSPRTDRQAHSLPSGRQDRPPGASAPPVSAFAVAAVAPGKATPSDVVAALRGSATVRLKGFTAQARTPSFLRPGVQFVSPSIAMEELRGVLVARSRRTRVILWAALLCTHVAVAALAAMWWAGQSARAAQEQFTRSGSTTVATSWKVVSVSGAGVLVRVGDDPSRAQSNDGKESLAGGRTVAVPVGGRLPNGELLTLVDASRGMYVTPGVRAFVSADFSATTRP